MSCEPIECPICYENVEGLVNSVTTECGHTFHAKCLMLNVAHNGFGCPCCRTQMVERPLDEDESEDEDEDSDYDSQDDESENSQVEINREPFSNFALLGLRLFMNRLEDVEHDPEDVMAENTLAFQSQQEQPDIPSVEYITERLIEQGVTMYQLVHTLVLDHQEYEEWDEGEDIYEDLSHRIRVIIDEFPTKRFVLADIPAQPAAVVHVSPPSSHPLRP